MAFDRKGEFGYFEFADFEFGLEKISSLTESNFSMAGTSAGAFGGQAKDNATLTVVGLAGFAGAGQTVISRVMTSAGVANFSPYLHRILFSQLTGVSTGVVVVDTGVVIAADFDAVSEAYAEFLSLEGNIFSIIGKTTVLFQGAPHRNATFASIGTSASDLRLQGVVDGSYLSSGQAGILLRGDSLAGASFSAAGIAAANLGLVRVVNGPFTAVGTAALLVQGQLVRGSVLTAPNGATVMLLSSAIKDALFGIQGIGSLSLRADTVGVGAYSILGRTILNIRPGSPVFGTLPHAADRVIRPEENRTAIWK